MHDGTPGLSEATSAPSLAVAQRAGTQPTHSREFLWKVHGYVNDYIRFADTKAAFCLGVASELVGALFSSKSQELFLKPPQTFTLLAWMSLAAFLFLVFSIGSAVIVVYPRLWIHALKGHSSYMAIAEFPSAKAFAADFGLQSDQELNDQLSNQLYSLAKVCRRKYRWVGVAMATAVIGGGLAVYVLLFKC